MVLPALGHQLVDYGKVALEAAAELEETLRGRRAALDLVVEAMKEALRPGLDVGQAAAILRALCRTEIYRKLMDESGWSPDEYESWLSETLKGQLPSPKACS